MHKTKRQRKEARWAKVKDTPAPRHRYFVGYPTDTSVLILDTALGEPAYPFTYQGESLSELDKRFPPGLWMYSRAGYPLTVDKHLVKEIL